MSSPKRAPNMEALYLLYTPAASATMRLLRPESYSLVDETEEEVCLE